MTFFLLALSIFFLWPGIVEFATTARISLHWSRLLAGAFTLLSAGQTAVFALLIEVVSLWMRQKDEIRKEQARVKSLKAEPVIDSALDPVTSPKFSELV